ncbi:MAG: hypothetical protein ACYC6W_07350 [Nitrosotalea sp.]
MNQQTRYSLKASILEYKNSQTSSFKESDFDMKEFQNMPNIVELTRIMFRTIAVENVRKMTLQERRVFYDITDKLVSLTYKLS